MAEEKPTEEGTPKEPEEGKEGKEGEEGFDAEKAKAKIAKVNSEAANLRKRLKEAEDNLKKFEDEGKSEDEKAAEKVRSLEGRATTAEAEVMRLRVAIKKGLTESQAKRLVGATEEELEADADELLETFGGKSEGGKEKEGGPSGKPKEKLKGGSDPSEEPDETDPRKLASRIRRPFQ